MTRSLRDMEVFINLLNEGDTLAARPSFRGKIVPVVKTLQIGERGGAYYVNSKGKKVYLKRYQKQQCIKDGRVEGDNAGKCRQVNVHTEDMAQEVLSKMGGIPKYAKMFIDTSKT